MRQLFREFVIAKHAAERTRRVWISQAWLTAALQRQKKIPELQSLLTPTIRRMTRGQQKLMLEMMSAKLGIPLRKVRLIRRGEPV